MRDLVGATWMRKILVGIGGLLVIAVVAVGTLALRSGYADPPGLFFGGGPLVTGEFVREPEPDWSFLGDVGTIDLQLLDPPQRRVPQLLSPLLQLTKLLTVKWVSTVVVADR